MLRWVTEIRRVNVLHETLLMSQYQAIPREGHLEQVLHIFALLEKKPNLILYTDPSFPLIEYSLFKTDPEEIK